MIDRADQRAGRRPHRPPRRQPPRAAASAGCRRSTTCRPRGSGTIRRAGSARRSATSGRPAVTIGTAAKWATVTEGEWPWAIVDEAYQMRSDALLRVAARFERALFVGDPGQLDPFSTVEIDRLDRPVLGPDAERGRGAAAPQPGAAGAPPAGVLAAARLGGPGGRGRVLPVHRVPLRHRARTTGRWPSPAEVGTTSLDAVLDAAAATGWGLYELPGPVHAAHRRGGRRRLRRARRPGPGPGCRRRLRASPAAVPLTADRIAIGAAHRDQVAAIRSFLPRGRAGRHRRHRQPAAGPRVRPDRRAAPALRPARRDRLPPGVGPAVRADVPAPARLRRGGPGRHRRAAGRPPVDRTGAPRTCR